MRSKLYIHRKGEHRMEINNCCFSLRDYNKACWIIEQQCNLNCEFCFHNQFETKKICENNGFSDYMVILSQLREKNIRHVILSGGEPLLSPDLFNIISLLQENGFSIGISTNAVNATPAFCRKLKQTTVNKITVNLAPICDNNGKITQNNNSTIIINGIQNLTSSGFFVTLNNILHKSTTKDILIQNIEYAIQWGAKAISFTVPVCKSFSECYTNDYFIEDQTVEKLRIFLEEIEKQMKPSICITLNCPKCFSNNCPANTEIFGVGWDKKLSTCLVKQYQILPQLETL